VIVIVAGVTSTIGADIRPVVGQPDEQDLSQTRTWRVSLAGPGEANAGSRAQTPVRYSGGSVPVTGEGRTSAGGGHTGAVGAGTPAHAAAASPAANRTKRLGRRRAIVEKTMGSFAAARQG
jgi:hypothetical protein